MNVPILQLTSEILLIRPEFKRSCNNKGTEKGKSPSSIHLYQGHSYQLHIWHIINIVLDLTNYVKNKVGDLSYWMKYLLFKTASVDKKNPLLFSIHSKFKDWIDLLSILFCTWEISLTICSLGDIFQRGILCYGRTCWNGVLCKESWATDSESYHLVECSVYQ